MMKIMIFTFFILLILLMIGKKQKNYVSKHL